MDHKFGIEIETFIGRDYSELKGAFRQEGLQVRSSEEGGPHGWNMKQDYSVEYTDDDICRRQQFQDRQRVWHPIEITSPVLTWASTQEVKKASKNLTDFEAWQNNTCGLHVHIDLGTRNLTNRQAYYLVRNYAQQKNALSPLLSPSRKSNTDRGSDNYYCKEIRGDQLAFLSRYNNDWPNNYFDTYNYRNYGYERYYAVNLHAWERYGTVEFRQHHGTHDADEILSWVDLMSSLVKHSQDGCLCPEHETTEAMIDHYGENMDIENAFYFLDLVTQIRKNPSYFYDRMV